MNSAATSAIPTRTRIDACPGALQTHPAADGGLARVRVSGGSLRAGQLRALAAAARELGNGSLELTSRGNVQLRGLAVGTETELGDRLAAAGLLPSATHERVRNVLASGLSGRTAGGHVDVRPWAAALDAGLCADASLAGLPGRYLATLDDGRGDVAGLGGDVGLLALSPTSVALLLAGRDSGLRVDPAGAVVLALAATRAFLAERDAQGTGAWRLAELTDGREQVTARLSGQRGHCGRPVGVPAPPVNGPVGALPQLDGRTALAALVPLGVLSAAQAELLAGLAPEVELTPWRTVVVPDLTEDTVDDAAVDLHRSGMVFDEASPWRLVTTCAGRPGCAKSLADVRADAAAAVVGGTLPAGGARQHWVGCERGCGRPHGAAVDVVATPAGYRIGRD
ncbi:precorrin-3B synthase [Modestobacter sp. DSM 44400]|uniref:precorrin-3B synthase n=1 Tax=Modestobacter sp. DSM 44400 TaxID=1550230 RepID=UPI00089D98F5|nr:precorrin-3B synthase [Modestobacter sp. DSM 44400]SDY15894.1 precorrin-3B synthase [Modestobacter sp. DSM 44400]